LGKSGVGAIDYLDYSTYKVTTSMDFGRFYKSNVNGVNTNTWEFQLPDRTAINWCTFSGRSEFDCCVYDGDTNFNCCVAHDLEDEYSCCLNEVDETPRSCCQTHQGLSE
jgi:hypothetical protein